MLKVGRAGVVFFRDVSLRLFVGFTVFDYVDVLVTVMLLFMFLYSFGLSTCCVVLD